MLPSTSIRSRTQLPAIWPTPEMPPSHRYIQAQKQQGADGEVVVYHFAEQASCLFPAALLSGCCCHTAAAAMDAWRDAPAVAMRLPAARMPPPVLAAQAFAQHAHAGQELQWALREVSCLLCPVGLSPQAFGDHAEVSQADITRYIEEQFPAA